MHVVYCILYTYNTILYNTWLAYTYAQRDSQGNFVAKLYRNSTKNEMQTIVPKQRAKRIERVTWESVNQWPPTGPQAHALNDLLRPYFTMTDSLLLDRKRIQIYYYLYSYDLQFVQIHYWAKKGDLKNISPRFSSILGPEKGRFFEFQSYRRIQIAI